MVNAVDDVAKKSGPKNHFTIGIEDDVTNTSLIYDDSFVVSDSKVFSAIFYGLGADGTVGANKNTVKIIGEETNLDVQGYFVYDSKKSGSRTVSYLRFGPEKIHSTYLIDSANFIGCHQFGFVNKLDILKTVAPDATFLLNSPYAAEKVWDHLPSIVQEIIIARRLKFFVIDAYRVAKDSGMGVRVNTIMQTCFFALANIIPREDAIAKIKKSIATTYASKGEEVLQKNYAAVDFTLANLHEVAIPKEATSKLKMKEMVVGDESAFVKNIFAKQLANMGDGIAVSQLPPDGTYPIETSKWEKRNISLEAPVWHEDLCIQCGKCSLVCPHSVIRAKTCKEEALKNAPPSFRSARRKGKDAGDDRYILQTYPEDCTGCKLCEENCPIKGEKAIRLSEKKTWLAEAKCNLEFSETIPYNLRETVNNGAVNGVQFLQPLFEFSGACAGCGETPYVKLITQLFGDRMIIANACGCSSVFGGSLPALPWATTPEGYGPSWSNSLFEDNAEFGYGFRLTADKHCAQALELLERLKSKIDPRLVQEIKEASQTSDSEIAAQRQRVALLKQQLFTITDDPRARDLESIADQLVKHSIWAVGGDGWAYDIGFGGLDHVVASGRDINLLILDTEVYSNTGGQASKATARGSVAKFAANGKNKAKKDLGLMLMSYGEAYIASIALGANPAQAIKAIKEAESYQGPSVVIAYSHCIAHGIDMSKGMKQQELAVKSGYWPLYRFNPERTKQGLNPLQLDFAEPSIPFAEYAKAENRYQILARHNPERAEMLAQQAQEDVDRRWKIYSKLAQ